MPRKTRKMKQRAAMRRNQYVPEVQEAGDEAESSGELSVRMRPAVSSGRGAPMTFDYSHIYSDLRRIALFAAFFFAVLIVLAFVLR